MVRGTIIQITVIVQAIPGIRIQTIPTRAITAIIPTLVLQGVLMRQCGLIPQALLAAAEEAVVAVQVVQAVVHQGLVVGKNK